MLTLYNKSEMIAILFIHKKNSVFWKMCQNMEFIRIRKEKPDKIWKQLQNHKGCTILVGKAFARFFE